MNEASLLVSGGLLPGDGDRPDFYPSQGSAPECTPSAALLAISGRSDCLRSPSIHQSSELAHVWKRNLFESSVAQCDKLCISLFGVCLDGALWPSLKWSYQESKQCKRSVAKLSSGTQGFKRPPVEDEEYVECPKVLWLDRCIERNQILSMV